MLRDTNPSPMQQAFLDAVLSGPAGRRHRTRDRIVRVLDRNKPAPIKESINLSFRTAKRLRDEGVL